MHITTRLLLTSFTYLALLSWNTLVAQQEKTEATPTPLLSSSNEPAHPLVTSNAPVPLVSSNEQVPPLVTSNIPSPLASPSTTTTNSSTNNPNTSFSLPTPEPASISDTALPAPSASPLPVSPVRNKPPSFSPMSSSLTQQLTARRKANATSASTARSSAPLSMGEPSSLDALDSNTITGPSLTSSNNAAIIAGITSNPNEKISVQFPHTSIMEVLSLYEKLTGKRIIRDSNLAGPDLSLIIADPVSKKDAVGLLESTMLVNGYALVPVDEKTIKIIGPSRPPRMEGLPLYQDAAELPTDGERLVSFYQPLHFLSPNEAINILQGVIQINPYGSIVAVPNTSAIVITDKTPLIQKAIALLQIIDREPSQIITEFIPLQRADAEKTVDTLNQIFGKDNGSSSTPAKTPSPFQPPTAAPITASGNDEERIFSGKVQFIPDKRTNRILLVTKAENYRYIRELIAKLDQAVQLEEPLVRPLNYIPATDVFPVLVDMLKNKDDDKSANNPTQQPTPQNPFNNSNNSASGAAGGAGGASGGMGGTGGSSGGAPGGSNGADLLSNTAQLQPPQSSIIGSTSIIADPTGNTIIVYGPPESKIKAKQIIDLLDRRPQQVYLAAVIGTMDLTDGMEYGSSYLFHYQGFNALAHSVGSEAAPSLFNSVGTAAGIGSSVGNAAGTTADTIKNAAGGLTLFGAIGGSVDMYAKFLDSTGKFRTISRPVVCTSNNHKATILSGEQIPYQSSSLSSVVAGGATNQTANSITSNVTYQNVLLKLEVIPLINSDNEVNLIIGQQNQSVDKDATTASVASGVNAPVVKTQQLTTSVRVPSGSTIVLGGLISDEKDEVKAGIPYIDKIPIIGPLLGGHTNNTKVRRELVVMIQPTIVDSNASLKRASNKQGGSTNLGERATNFEKQLQPTPTPTPDKKKFKLFRMPKTDSF